MTREVDRRYFVVELDFGRPCRVVGENDDRYVPPSMTIEQIIRGGDIRDPRDRNNFWPFGGSVVGKEAPPLCGLPLKQAEAARERLNATPIRLIARAGYSGPAHEVRLCELKDDKIVWTIP